MTDAKDQELVQIQPRAEFHLIDLLPRACCHAEGTDLETNLQRLEQALDDWLLAKTNEIEPSQTPVVIAGRNAEMQSPVGLSAVGRDRIVPAGMQEGSFMSTDERDVLTVLQEELEFVEQGGYGRSVRTPWQPKSPFQDSVTCINYTYSEKAHPCSECHLIDFVPSEHRAEQVPCHFIPLNDSGETIENLESAENQQKLEGALKDWLRMTIKELERAHQETQSAVKP